MSKELGTAGEIVAADFSGGFHNFKEAVYGFLGNFFSWLSTHQSLTLVIILIVLAIVIWYILRVRKFRKQLEEKVSRQNLEVGEKEALIKELNNKLEALQQKMSDQQRFIGEALLNTLKAVTGYDIDQLQAFFKSLTEISKNPLQIADNQVKTMPGYPQVAETSDGYLGQDEAQEKMSPDAERGEVANADENEEK